MAYVGKSRWSDLPALFNIKENEMSTVIEAIKADIIAVKNVEAIVNATNSSMKGTKGVDGRIHKAAGPELLKECKTLGGCNTGDAKITGAYNLPYKAIIHTVGPIWKDGKKGESILLENCYLHVLQLAEVNGIRSLAFPSISTGTYKYPLEEAAKVAVETVTKYCNEHPDSFDYICWALLVEPTRRVYEEEILSKPVKNKDALVMGPDGDVLQAQYSLSVKDTPLLTGPVDELQESNDFYTPTFDDIIEIEFSDDVPKADRWDYAAAAASGLLSGALSIIWSKEFDLEAAHNWGTDQFEKVVIKVAKTQGFEKDDLEKAIVFLENKFPLAGDALKDPFGGGLQHHLRDFTHHPTIVGLIFSILSQFIGKGFGTDTDGKFITPDLPEGAFIGKNFEEKILFGTIYWVFHLISDMDGSHLNPGAGTGIPGPVLSFLKELSTLPIFKDITKDYKEKEITFSQWISKMFNGTYFRNENGDPIRFDLRTEIGIGAHLLNQAKPVIVNECIVRTVYFFRRLSWELKNKRVTSVYDLDMLEPQNFLPYKSRSLTRMLTVSSGVFVLVNTSGTAIKAAIKGKGNQALMAKEFFLNLNYVGIARFGIACVADAKYIAEDVREAYRKYQENQRRKFAKENEQLFKEYKFLSLDESKLRLLYSLESHLVMYDIVHTKGTKQKEAKLLWLCNWESSISKGLAFDKENLFIRNEDLLYSNICSEWNSNYDHSWMLLLALELSLFTAYTPLGLEEDKKFKGLKATDSYISNVFCKRQFYISEKAINNLSKSVLRYKSKLTGKAQKALIGFAGTAVVTAATGGLALAFAPEIAAVIAGEAVAGLYGAALTSASLAFVGGGALAAGGLGVAGGTAILTGGGALIGMASSGTISMINVVANTSEEYVLNECAKLLTVCRTMLAYPEYHWENNVKKIKDRLDVTVDNISKDIELAEMQTGDKDRSFIKKMKTGRKHMSKSSKELDVLLNWSNNKE